MSWILYKAKLLNNHSLKDADTTTTTTTTAKYELSATANIDPTKNVHRQSMNKRNSLGFFSTLESRSTVASATNAQISISGELLRYTSQELLRNFNDLDDYINKTPTSASKATTRAQLIDVPQNNEAIDICSDFNAKLYQTLVNHVQV